MIRWIADTVLRRRLRRIMGRMPHLLRQRYGSSDYYTAGQVAAVARMIGLKGKTLRLAHALACRAEEFSKAFPGSDQDEYAALRRRMCRVLGISEFRLNCRPVAVFCGAAGREDSLGVVDIDAGIER